MKTRDLALAGMLAALQILTLLIAYVIPTIKLALLFAASVYPAVLLRAGVNKKVIAAASLASAGLTVLLIQIPEIQGAFAIFFVWYALLHESTRGHISLKQQAIRWSGFALAVAAFYFAAKYMLSIELGYALWILILAGIGAFVFMQILYELAVKEFIKITKIRYDGNKITFK